MPKVKCLKKSTTFMSEAMSKSTTIYIDTQQKYSFMPVQPVQPSKTEMKGEDNEMLLVVLVTDNPAIFWSRTKQIHRCVDGERKQVCVGTSLQCI